MDELCDILEMTKDKSTQKEQDEVNILRQVNIKKNNIKFN